MDSLPQFYQPSLESKILIVEDERIIAEDIKDCLVECGHTVVGIASNGTDALKLIEKSRPDIALMDINIKGEQDGTELAALIGNLYNVPVVYLTAHTDPDTLARVKPTIPLAFLVKPFNEKELCSAVEIALYRANIESPDNRLSPWHTSVINSLEDGILAVDDKARVRFMNAAAEELLGCRFQEANGYSIGALLRCPYSALVDALEKCIHAAIPDYQSSVHIPDVVSVRNSDLSLQATVTPLEVNSRASTGGVIVLRKSVTFSELTPAETEPTAFSDPSPEKLEAIRMLLEGLTHGINNSLSGSIGFLELMKNQKEISEEFQQWAEIAIDGCQNAASLLNKLRAFYNLDLSSVESLDLNELIIDILDSVSSSEVDGTSIRFLPANYPITVNGSSDQLSQAVTNILVNALSATKGRNGVVEVHTFTSTFMNKDSTDNEQSVTKYAVLSVKDDGAGIELAHLNQIFDPFFTTMKDGKVFGRGLGLTVAYGIIRNHSGWITVDSTVGKGSTFQVYLPYQSYDSCSH